MPSGDAGGPPESAFTRRLKAVGSLAGEDTAFLEGLQTDPVTWASHTDIIGEGDPVRSPLVLQQGWACRYRRLEDGRRQILSFLLPGDHLAFFINRGGDVANHAVMALTEVRLLRLSGGVLGTIQQEYPRIGEALRLAVAQQYSLLAEHLVRLGRRTAYERTAHLLLELAQRLDVVGLAGRDEYLLPLTQEELADNLGLSTVHINRTLKQLRGEGLIVLKDRHMVLREVARLVDIAEYRSEYLDESPLL